MILELDDSITGGSLNGLFSFIGQGKRNDNADASVKAKIQDIKNENGFDDIMYMNPDQAIKSLNKMVEELAYGEAKRNNSGAKANNTVDQARKHAKYYSDASKDVVSQFRQYALAMDGSIEKIGDVKKTIEGFSFEAPFYKLVLPEKARDTTLSDSFSKEDLAAVLQKTEPEKANNNNLIIGGAVLSVLLLGTVIYVSKTKSKTKN